MHQIRILVLLIQFSWTSFLRADAAIEGVVPIPSRPSLKLEQRYQTQSVTMAAPEPPTAVVYLEGSFPDANKNADVSRVVEMSQKNLQFSPGLLPIQVHTTVKFPNLDDTYHNVFSYSKNKRFDLGRYRKDEPPGAQTFDEPGAIKLYCEVHEHMRGTILVLDTPYFQKTDPQGKFRMEHLPAGKFVLKAWLDEKTILQRTVELKDGVTLTVDF